MFRSTALSALFVLLLLACGHTPALAQDIIGETTVLTTLDGGNGGYLVAQSATLTRPAVLSSLSFYVSAAVGNLILGLYDATGPNGGPGALKAQTASFVPVKGWNTKLPTTTPTLAAGKYWLAFTPSSSSLNFELGQGYGSLVNQYGTWTFSAVTNQFGNGILLNGSPAPAGAGQGFGTTLLSYNNQTYALAASTWFQWNGTGFAAISGDPRSGTAGGSSITNTTMSLVYVPKAFGTMPTTFTSGFINDPHHWSFYATFAPSVALGTITGETLSGTSTPGGASGGATIGTIGVTMSSGSFGGTLSLSDNTNFQLSGSTLQTKIALTVGATYPLTITATQSGAGGSPFSKAFTITSTGITGISLTDGPFGGSQFVGGSPSGTAIGQIMVAEVGGTFGGTFGLTGADAASFSIAGGWLYTSGVVAAGTYNIIITATQGGVGGSPKAVPFVITGTASGAQQYLFLTGNQTFSPGAHNLTAGQTVTLEAVGSGSGSGGVNNNSGGCGGAYAHQLGLNYTLTSTDVSNGMAAVVGAAGANGLAGHTSSIADGNGALLASAGGGGDPTGPTGCAGGALNVGAGYNGGKGGGAPSYAGGGGGGSAGPTGPGGNAGQGSSSAPGGGGGGGAANGLGNAADAGATANGGKGGGANGGAAGVGNTTPTSGAAGTLGGGGGGGGGTTSGSANAGNGGSGGQVCNIWDATHCIAGGVGGGGSSNSPGRGGNGGVPVGYGCGGGGFGSSIGGASDGTGSAGCPGLVVIGWNGSPPVQAISSVTLTGNSYVVGSAVNTVIGTIAVAMNPTSPPFNYPTSTITVSDSTHFKVVNVGNVPTLEANATLSAGSYTTTITATQSGATGSPFTSGTQTLTGRSLSITATPSVPSISSGAAKGSLVSTLQGVWSDASPFTGTYSFVGTDSAPGNYGNDANTFSIVTGAGSSAQVIINPAGPGVGFDGGTVQNVTVQAVQ